jgi:hypothetical protein
MIDEEFHEAIMALADKYQAETRRLDRGLAEDLAYITLCTETGLSTKKVEVNEELNEFLRPGKPDPVEFPNEGGE